jgi:hypothetical protein
MLALLYLVLAISLGYQISRRFCSFENQSHSWAAAFLLGLLISAWATYLFALAFSWSARPLVWANLLFFVIAGCGTLLLAWPRRDAVGPKPFRLGRAEKGFLIIFVVISGWLMFGTLTMHEGDVRLTSVVWNDFGPNLALMQSFALDHNFPTEYPYFTGEPIRYHFLFWFAAANLEFLGLPLDWALNLLSTLSMVALLVTIMTMGVVMFRSHLIGGLAALLVFFSGTMSFVPFLKSQTGILAGLSSILHLKHWLSSGFHYGGEDWGIWSVSILYVQRHLLGAIGIFFLVLIFLIQHYQGQGFFNVAKPTLVRHSPADETIKAAAGWPSVVTAGALIGLLPLWNGPIFLSALIVIGCLFVLLPDRRRIGGLLLTATAIGAPQVFYLGFAQTAHRMSTFRWGFTVEQPSFAHVASYFLFTFGPKLFLASIALVLLSKSYRLFCLAISSLVLVAFGTQLSIDMMNNQKFIYLWLMLLNLFAAFALVSLWRIRHFGKPLAIAAGLTIIATGAIEMFRVHNDNWVDVPFRKNPLSDWLFQHTKPTDLFLTDRFVHHPILMTGRRIFYGWPYFSWSMGYPTAERDAVYERMVKEQNPNALLEVLRVSKIDYVAIDDGLRHGPFDVGNHEAAFASRCAAVFEDKAKHFGNLTIYKVPR